MNVADEKNACYGAKIKKVRLVWWSVVSLRFLKWDASKKTFFCTLLPYRFFHVFGLLLFVGALLFASALSAKKKITRPYASIVMDAQSGRILHQRGSRTKVYPASLTKMMTLYMVFDALRRKKLGRHQRIRVSRHAARQEPSNIKLKAGDRISVEQAILSLVCRSANDSAVVLAEAIGGSEGRFARLMTQKARQLGLRHTTFHNASGLFHPKQTTTAHDMARLAVHLIKHFPHEYHYFKRRRFSYKGQLYKTHNRLVGRIHGVDGLKTGYIRRSGFNLVTSAKRNGRRLVGVVIGGKTAKWRDRHMTSLIEMGFVKCAKMLQQKVAPPFKSSKQVRVRYQKRSQGPDRVYIHQPARNIKKGPVLRSVRLRPSPPKRMPKKQSLSKGVPVIARRRQMGAPESIDDLLTL